MNTRIKSLTKATGERSTELEQARKSLTAAETAASKAEQDYASAPVEDFDTWQKARDALQHAQRRVEVAKQAVELCEGNMRAAQTALATAEREDKIAELSAAASLDAYHRDTAKDTKAIADALETIRAAAARVDSRWSQVVEADRALRTLGQPGTDTTWVSRVAPLFVQALDRSPGHVLAVLTNHYAGPLRTKWDGFEATVVKPLNEKGLAALLVAGGLLECTPAPEEIRAQQLSRLQPQQTTD